MAALAYINGAWLDGALTSDTGTRRLPEVTTLRGALQVGMSSLIGYGILVVGLGAFVTLGRKRGRRGERSASPNWWERTDGEPGVSDRAALVIFVVATLGFGLFGYVQFEGDKDRLLGAAVCGLLPGSFAAFMFRWDPRERSRRSAERDIQRFREWRAGRRKQS